jgi:uncharacterized protein
MAQRPLRIVIPGGTGQLGQILARHFHEQGHRVTAICRHPKPAEWSVVTWTGEELGPWAEVIDGSDVVINLAGKSLHCRHSPANQRAIKNSRTITTGLLGQAVAQASRPPFLWLNASTAGVYENASDRAVDEDSGAVHKDDLRGREPWHFTIDAALCCERALFAADTPKTRRIALRSAPVMSPDCGGMFETFLSMVRYGFGGAAGSGRQYVSWIHDVDFIRAVDYLIKTDGIGPVVNVCSPRPVPNRTFMHCLRQAWCTMYVGLPAPGWLLKLRSAFLDIESESLLRSERVLPGRLLASGFEFHFPNWRPAAQDLVSRWRELHAD